MLPKINAGTPGRQPGAPQRRRRLRLICIAVELEPALVKRLSNALADNVGFAAVIQMSHQFKHGVVVLFRPECNHLDFLIHHVRHGTTPMDGLSTKWSGLPLTLLYIPWYTYLR